MSCGFSKAMVAFEREAIEQLAGRLVKCYNYGIISTIEIVPRFKIRLRKVSNCVTGSGFKCKLAKC